MSNKATNIRHPVDTTHGYQEGGVLLCISALDKYVSRTFYWYSVVIVAVALHQPLSYVGTCE